MRHLPMQQTDAKAVISVLLGLTSFVLGPATGIPAVIVGSIARRDIARSNGTLTGNTIAGAGTLAGFFGMGFFAVVFLWLGTAVLAPSTDAALMTVDDSSAQAKVTAPVRPAPERIELEPFHPTTR
ncbi:MAG: DUF4190 domain-containing protein [Labilithrix sp.]|nr:DUF4190 domain-containing protein [Labilithrix sp.]MCW5814074.1 DUF4190 domain-containing protein [Labilithrix sp.]